MAIALGIGIAGSGSCGDKQTPGGPSLEVQLGKAQKGGKTLALHVLADAPLSNTFGPTSLGLNGCGRCAETQKWFSVISKREEGKVHKQSPSELREKKQGNDNAEPFTTNRNFEKQIVEK